MEISRNFFSENLFAGNYSENYKNAVIKYASNLSSKGLPIIFSTKHLSLLIGISYVDLKRIIGKRDIMYHFYQISKKNGGKREISVPHAQLKFIQKWIKTRILDRLDFPENAHGYIKKKSILTNALNHTGNEAILNIDLKKFFDSISEFRVYHLFKTLGYHTNLSVDLAKLCTSQISDAYFNTFTDDEKELFESFYDNSIGVLPQGACTSPAISNLICNRLDRRFSAYAKNNAINYSRYSDDITFSGDLDNLPSFNLIKKIVEEEKFHVNMDKVKLRTNGQRRQVTGLIVDNSVRVPKAFKKTIYRHLYFCEKFSPKVHFDYLSKKNKVEKGYQKEWLFGKIRFVYSIEPTVGIKMMKQFSKLQWDL